MRKVLVSAVIPQWDAAFSLFLPLDAPDVAPRAAFRRFAQSFADRGEECAAPELSQSWVSALELLLQVNIL